MRHSGGITMNEFIIFTVICIVGSLISLWFVFRDNIKTYYKHKHDPVYLADIKEEEIKNIVFHAAQSTHTPEEFLQALQVQGIIDSYNKGWYDKTSNTIVYN